MIVYGNGQSLFSFVLTDDVFIQNSLDVFWLGQIRSCRHAFSQRFLVVLVQHLLAELDALVADIDAATGNQPAHLAFTLAAERAGKVVIMPFVKIHIC